MGVDIERTSGIIGTLRKMSNRELATTIFLVVVCVAGAFWVERRYANLEATQDELRQRQIETQDLQKQVINVVNSLPIEVRKEIIERSQLNQALSTDPKKFIAPQK
jgi:hypothetical protein